MFHVWRVSNVMSRSINFFSSPHLYCSSAFCLAPPSCACCNSSQYIQYLSVASTPRHELWCLSYPFTAPVALYDSRLPTQSHDVTRMSSQLLWLLNAPSKSWPQICNLLRTRWQHTEWFEYPLLTCLSRAISISYPTNGMFLPSRPKVKRSDSCKSHAASSTHSSCCYGWQSMSGLITLRL